MSSAPQAGGADPTQQAAGAAVAGSRAHSRAERVRLLLAGLLGGLAVAFALLNLARVEVDWILGTWQTPLIVVILVSLLVGAVLGFVVARRRLAGGKRKSTSRRTDAPRA